MSSTVFLNLYFLWRQMKAGLKTWSSKNNLICIIPTDLKVRYPSSCPPLQIHHSLHLVLHSKAHLHLHPKKM